MSGYSIMSTLSSFQFNVLQLWCMPGVGHKTIQALQPLLHQGWSVGHEVDLDICPLSNKQINALQNQKAVAQGQRATYQTLEWSALNNHHILFSKSTEYPDALKTIDESPLVLMVRGNVGALSKNGISLVGSRNPSREGVQNANIFATYLASMGFSIISGGAAGIDRAAHEAALKVSKPTLAVLGHGLDHCYPKSHFNLYESIVEQGALISEFPLGVAPKPYFFPRRNRIITGLSKGVCVVEASMGSGSLVSAKWAVDQGREVFAIPGSIHNPRAKGCHWLIQQGAKLVQSGEDILSELEYVLPDLKAQLIGEALNSQSPATIEMPTREVLVQLPLEEAILKVLSVKSFSIEEITAYMDYADLDQLMETIICLELESQIKRMPETGVFMIC